MPHHRLLIYKAVYQLFACDSACKGIAYERVDVRIFRHIPKGRIFTILKMGCCGKRVWKLLDLGGRWSVFTACDKRCRYQDK
jgi:hypothetical protein